MPRSYFTLMFSDARASSAVLTTLREKGFYVDRAEPEHALLIVAGEESDETWLKTLGGLLRLHRAPRG